MHSAVGNVSSFISFPRCKANDEECEMTFTEVATQVGCSRVAAERLLWMHSELDSLPVFHGA